MARSETEGNRRQRRSRDSRSLAVEVPDGCLARQDGTPDPDRDFLLDLGNSLEPVIAGLYEKQTGRTLIALAPPGIWEHPKHPMLLGSPDRLVRGERRGVELKS